MKKNLILIFLALQAIVVNAEKIGGIYYELSGDEAMVMPSDYSGIIVIPESITLNKTYKVTSIYNGAFRDCTRLTSITLPNSLTCIGEYTFYGCIGLTSISIPNSVITINDYAFAGCHNLSTIIIGSSVQFMSNTAFVGVYPQKVIWMPNMLPKNYNCLNGIVNYVSFNPYMELTNIMVYPFLSSIFEVDGVKYVPVSPSERTCDAIDCVYNKTAENINIGETVSNKGISLTVKQISPFVFCGNTYIKDVKLNFNGKICSNAFNNCSALETVQLGQGITSVGSGAFCFCSKLQSIIIPNSVDSISSNTFEGCSALTSVIIGNKVKMINNSAFNNCTSISTIQIPQNVTSIGNYVFNGCSSLKYVLMDDGDSELTMGNGGYNSMFATCPLDSVYIGRKILCQTSNYANSPFYRNTTLRSVTITDKETEIPNNEFYGCTNLKNIKIGDRVIKIGDYAFSGCSSLDKFVLGSSVETIGIEAFSDCTNMTTLISKATTPPVCGSQALDDINKWDCILTVPKGYMSLYQKEDQWKNFFFIKEGDDDSGIISEPKKCATPTISYTDGELTFNCETEGALCQSSITDDDIASYVSNKVKLFVTYTINVYAVKAGYENSEVATATLCWVEQLPDMVGVTDEEDAVEEVKAIPVLIQTEGNTITVQGANEGTDLVVYSISGIKEGSAIAGKGITTISTSLHSGSVAIVRIGDKTVKIAMK